MSKVYPGHQLSSSFLDPHNQTCHQTSLGRYHRKLGNRTRALNPNPLSRTGAPCPLSTLHGPFPSTSERRKKNPIPATYLKEPVAPPVESRYDGGMDIAAVQALGRERKNENSVGKREGREEDSGCNREEQEGPRHRWQAWGD